MAARGLIILVGCLFYRNTVPVCAVQGAAAEAPPGAGATGFEGNVDEVAAGVGDIKMKIATRGSLFSLAAAPVLRAPG